MTEHDKAVETGVAALPPARSQRQNRTMWGLFTILAVVALLALLGFIWGNQARQDAHHADKQVDKANAVAVINHNAVKSLAAQVEGYGGTPVVQPSDVPSTSTKGDTGAQGPAGPAPTDAQVLNAVGAYLAMHPVASPKIDYTQLRAYVVSYLADNPAPAGPSGSPGPSGANGSNGQDGSNASDTQVSQAVAAYLTEHPPAPGPSGASGANGANGAAGKDGVDGKNGVDGTDGEPPVSWTYAIGSRTYECDRATPFDPSAPTYACTLQTAN